MRWTVVSPSATRAARTRLTDARKSVAITSAPCSPSTPRTRAVEPCKEILAPSRPSSGTCMNRLSNTVSRMTDAPVAMVIKAMNCACTFQHRTHRAEMLEMSAEDLEATAGYRGGDGVGSSLDAVGDQIVPGVV